MNHYTNIYFSISMKTSMEFGIEKAILKRKQTTTRIKQCDSWCRLSTRSERVQSTKCHQFIYIPFLLVERFNWNEPVAQGEFCLSLFRRVVVIPTITLYCLILCLLLRGLLQRVSNTYEWRKYWTMHRLSRPQTRKSEGRGNILLKIRSFGHKH